MYVGGDMTVTGTINSTPQEGTVNINVTTGEMSVYTGSEWVILDGTVYKPKKSLWKRLGDWFYNIINADLFPY
jgi:hypothetical protein